MRGRTVAFPPVSSPPAEEPLERRLATGTLVQQAGQAVGVVVMLVVFTLLGRRLSLTAFGVYGIASGFAAYLLFILGSAETAAVRELAGAQDQAARDRGLSSALAVYALLGLAAGVLSTVVGLALLQAFDIPHALIGDARIGIVLVGAATIVGWPLKLFHDVLRGTHRYQAAGVAEACGYLLFGLVMVALVLADAPLWALIGVGGALPLCIGLCGLATALATRLPFHVRRDAVDRHTVRSLTHVAGGMSFIGVADVVISSLDRTVLALFRPPSVVGLYEAAARPNTVLRQLSGSFGVTLLPSVARLHAANDAERLRELFVRGTRYVIGAVVPPCLVLICLGGPLLGAWLGEDFAAAGTALGILVAWWMVAPSGMVGSTLMVVDGRLRLLAALSWSVAGLNLVLSVGLTAWLGLEGVVLGTTVAYCAVLPVTCGWVLRRTHTPLRRLAIQAWLPGYGLGLVLAAAFVAARHLLDLDPLGPILAVSVAGCAAYWALFYVLALTPSERALVRHVLHLP
jgi:O-antigen/teichoic acid export membrane protein